MVLRDLWRGAACLALAGAMALYVSCGGEDEGPGGGGGGEVISFDGAGEPGDVFQFDINTATATADFKNITTGLQSQATFQAAGPGMDIYALAFPEGTTYGMYIHGVAGVMALPGDQLVIGAPRRTSLSVEEVVGTYNYVFSGDGTNPAVWGTCTLGADGAMTFTLKGMAGNPAFSETTIDTRSAAQGEGPNVVITDSADAAFKAEVWFLPGKVMIADMGPGQGFAVGVKASPFDAAAVAGTYQYLMNTGVPGLFTLTAEGGVAYEAHGNTGDIAQATETGAGTVEGDDDQDGFVMATMEDGTVFQVLSLPGQVLLFLDQDGEDYGVGLML